MALLSLAFAFACAGEDRTGLAPVAGAAGQVGTAGSSGSSGTAGSAGSAGTGGTDPGPAPSACLEPGDAFTWPPAAPVDVPAHRSWKAELEVPVDAFFSMPQGDPVQDVRWVKFIVLASDPTRVYFQDAASAPFHYEFARDRVPAFAGMSRAEFDAVTLHEQGRQAILGAVLIPGDSLAHPEYGVQLVSNDDLHPELVETILQSVAAHVAAPAGTRAYYFPSGTSATCITGKAAELAARGVTVGSVDRWLEGDACYAPGWAVGKLVALAAAEVDAAYLDGRLTPDDILLLTDAAPAELPFVAGVLTLAPSTPNSHPAILARSYGVPFAYVRDPEAVARAQALVGQSVVVSTTGAAGRDAFARVFGGCNVRFIDVGALGPADLAQLRALSEPPPIEVAAKQASGVLARPTAGLVPADIVRVGGKAAHFGVLAAAAPENTPSPALALTFDLWDAFMDQAAPGGAAGSLRDEIARRLAEHAWPADLRALDATLEGVRDLIEDAPFPAALREAVLSALGDFDPETRIRFRSSTNVEDSATFTGAGLYDSATGCLADDLDTDGAGPSLCNPAELEERGVFRAIQRVYASFYFNNAYFERVRRGVDEAQVGMAVLVHYSVPDSEELANGVATLKLDEFSRAADLVTQLGATSVTNPDGSALPEEVHVEGASADYIATQRTSSLVPLGAHVLSYEDDYRSLMSLLSQVADGYAAATGQALPFSLDFEYKKVTPGVLSLRQVRPLPLLDSTRDVTPLLINEPEKLCVYGSERADAFAAHRLKTRIALDGADVWLTAEQLAQRLYAQARVEYVSGTEVATLEGDPASFAGAQHGLEQNGDEASVSDAWTAAGASWSLRTRLSSAAARDESPVRTPDDFFFELAASWSAPVPYLEFSTEAGGGFVAATRTEESVELWGHCPEDVTVTSELPHVEQSFSGPDGLSIETSYWFPPPPRGVTAGYTAPALEWEQTTITGLTSTPVVLSGYFSQTYAPYHHNFGGQYIFDPRLEPGLSAETRAELQTADVALLVVIDQDGPSDELWALGFDGALRRLEASAD